MVWNSNTEYNRSAELSLSFHIGAIELFMQVRWYLSHNQQPDWRTHWIIVLDPTSSLSRAQIVISLNSIRALTGGIASNFNSGYRGGEWTNSLVETAGNLFYSSIRHSSSIAKQSIVLVIKVTEVPDILCALVLAFDKSIQFSRFLSPSPTFIQISARVTVIAFFTFRWAFL